MKVHFIADLEGDKKVYQKILDYVRKFGYQLITNHSIIRDLKDVKNETPEETQLYVQKMQNWIKTADIIVVESTRLGLGTGYETSLAIYMGKQVIVMYKPNPQNKPFVLHGSNLPNLQVIQYSNDTLKESLALALEYASEKIDTRFTMLLPQDIVQYLDSISRSGESRSEYIRKLIRQDMKKKREK